MENICTAHEREALKILEEYADHSEETRYGTVKWIEPNDEAFRISWGRVVIVKLTWFADHTGWCCRITVKDDESGEYYDDLLLRDETDDDQEAVVNRLCDWSADFQAYRPKDIRQVLADMADYAMNCEEEEELRYYFEQMTETGLFHDAMGEVVRRDDDGKVLVITSY